MAEDSKLEVRDLREQDNGPYLTRPTSELALKAQLDAETVSGKPHVVNPNPLGGEDKNGQYVGTDPIYQNSSTVANEPFDAQDGVDQEAEKRVKSLHSLKDVPEGEQHEDFGLGGRARVSDGSGPAVTRTLVPGQEGYDKAKAEAQQGPPLRVFVGDEDENKEDDGEVVTADQRGVNAGASTQAPGENENPDGSSKGAGDKLATKSAAKPPKS